MLITAMITPVGLIFIARSGGSSKIEYRRIVLPLILYLASKYGYGLIIKAFSPYISSTLQLFAAMIIISIIIFPKAAPKKIFRNNPKGALYVILARIPNTVGTLVENMVIAVSLVNYSFIQPMILVTLFVIGLIRRERCSKLNLIGSVICVIGVVAFQLV